MNFHLLRILMLSYLDSNQDRQNQKLQCYHYTIRQSYCPNDAYRLKRYKGRHLLPIIQIFLTFFVVLPQFSLFLMETTPYTPSFSPFLFSFFFSRLLLEPRRISLQAR